MNHVLIWSSGEKRLFCRSKLCDTQSPDPFPCACVGAGSQVPTPPTPMAITIVQNPSVAPFIADSPCREIVSALNRAVLHPLQPQSDDFSLLVSADGDRDVLLASMHVRHRCPGRMSVHLVILDS